MYNIWYVKSLKDDNILHCASKIKKMQDNVRVCSVLRGWQKGRSGQWLKRVLEEAVWGALVCSSGWLGVQQFLHHELGVAHAASQLLTAAELLQQRQLVGAEVSLLVDVGHRSHQWTQDQLGVVLAEGKWRFRISAQSTHGTRKTNCVRQLKRRLLGEDVVRG